MELIDKLQEHYKDFSKRMRGRIYYDDQETKTLLDGYTEELASFFSKELSRAREEGRKELLDSIINGIKQLRDIVGIFSPMSSKIRARQEGEISAYNDILGKLSKLTTK